MGRGRRRLDGEERTEYFPRAPRGRCAPTSTRSPAAGDGGVTTRDILRAGGLSSRERPELLIGGPPCVAFSKSGFWLDWKRDGIDPAASLLQAYTRVLAEAKPRFFILENVYALTFNNKASQPAFERLLNEIDEAGYQFTWQVLNAADYGVPAGRPRLFIVGCRKRERLPDLPEPTHHGQWERRETEGGPLPHVTTGEALADLVTEPEPEEVVRGSGATCFPRSRPARTTCTSPPSAATPTRSSSGGRAYWSFLLKLDPDRARRRRSRPSPARTSGRSTGRTAGSASRSFKRLFTFPDDYEFVGRRISVQAQLGNSVPPLLAQQVAEQRRCAELTGRRTRRCRAWPARRTSRSCTASSGRERRSSTS